MKQLAGIFVGLGTLILTACAGHETIDRTPAGSLAAYKSVTVGSIKTQDFLDKHPAIATDPKWAEQVKVAAEAVRTRVDDYYKTKNISGGQRDLIVNAELTEFDPGNQALRYLVGFGAGKGKIGFDVKLLDKDSSNVVAEFFAYGSLTMGALGGDIAVAYNKCGNAIIEYIEKASGRPVELPDAAPVPKEGPKP